MAGGIVAIGAVALGILILQRLVPAPADSPAIVMRPPLPTPSPAPAPSPSPVATSASPVPSSPAPAPSLSPVPPSSPPATVRAPLTVLNNSRRPRLAARAAAEFEEAGWPIREVGNFRGRVAVTTVYYPPGGEAAAEQLRREFPAIRRARPRFEGLPGTGLTVVLTRDYPA